MNSLFVSSWNFYMQLHLKQGKTNTLPTIYTAYSLYHIRTSSDFIPEKNHSISTKGREYFCRLIFICKVTLSTVWLTVFAVIMIYLTKVVEDKFTFLI